MIVIIITGIRRRNCANDTTTNDTATDIATATAIGDSYDKDYDTDDMDNICTDDHIRNDDDDSIEIHRHKIVKMHSRNGAKVLDPEISWGDPCRLHFVRRM